MESGQSLGEARSYEDLAPQIASIDILHTMAATRLRKTFQYPADDDDLPKDLDEEGHHGLNCGLRICTNAGT